MTRASPTAGPVRMYFGVSRANYTGGDEQETGVQQVLSQVKSTKFLVDNALQRVSHRRSHNETVSFDLTAAKGENQKGVAWREVPLEAGKPLGPRAR
jgi:hypothetical protein